ncbi:hypothetical protein AMATHDRAFT_71514 [Amanita thiersii Skay4041]|uniref:C2H2-type domain-containing protein n=1 Tax=Amanita thiersii Skay4041 TaxID=703135 RepID=A0A2A9N7Q1_9AGAR|nr:hypothetical protein AMATHDRAFT_71514 [Amanita thiersii Skay4041]
MVQCVDCRKRFGTEEALESHWKAKGHGIPLRCGMCGKGPFRSISGLEEHAWNEHRILPSDTYCIVCNKTFKAPLDLRNHNSSPVHLPRNKKCIACPSLFKTPSGIGQHIESSCPKVGDRHKVTAAIQSLEISPKILLKEPGMITGARQLQVITLFTTEGAFNGRGYECHLCHRTFRAQHSLVSHLNSASHDDYEFMCPKCNKHVKLVSSLVQHLESGSCGLSSIADVEKNYIKLLAMCTRALTL